ncbi:N-acetyltransferase family protein [Pseudomonas borbori]
MNRIAGRKHLPRGIRRYTEADLEAMTEIFNETAATGANSPVVRPLSVKEMTFFIDFYVKEGDPVYVLERAGEVIGWMTVNRFCWGAQACRLTGEVSIYVRHDYIGKGMGIRLGQASVILAERYGFETLVAWVIDKNEASKHMASGFGGELWGHMPKIARFGEVRCDVKLYGLPLTPRAPEAMEKMPYQQSEASAQAAYV